MPFAAAPTRALVSRLPHPALLAAAPALFALWHACLSAQCFPRRQPVLLPPPHTPRASQVGTCLASTPCDSSICVTLLVSCALACVCVLPRLHLCACMHDVMTACLTSDCVLLSEAHRAAATCVLRAACVRPPVKRRPSLICVTHISIQAVHWVVHSAIIIAVLYIGFPSSAAGSGGCQQAQAQQLCQAAQAVEAAVARCLRTQAASSCAAR